MNYEQFTLQSVKITKNEVNIKYHVQGDVQLHDDTFQRKKKDVHPDFPDSLQPLAILVTQVFDMPEENVDAMKVNGISLTTKKDNEYVIVMSSYTVSNGLKSSLNTPLINTSDDEWPGQEQLQVMTEKVSIECFNYLFGNKTNEPELPFGEEVEEALPTESGTVKSKGKVDDAFSVDGSLDFVQKPVID